MKKWRTCCLGKNLHREKPKLKKKLWKELIRKYGQKVPEDFLRRKQSYDNRLSPEDWKDTHSSKNYEKLSRGRHLLTYIRGDV